MDVKLMPPASVKRPSAATSCASRRLDNSRVPGCIGMIALNRLSALKVSDHRMSPHPRASQARACPRPGGITLLSTTSDFCHRMNRGRGYAASRDRPNHLADLPDGEYTASFTGPAHYSLRTRHRVLKDAPPRRRAFDAGKGSRAYSRASPFETPRMMTEPRAMASDPCTMTGGTADRIASSLLFGYPRSGRHCRWPGPTTLLLLRAGTPISLQLLESVMNTRRSGIPRLRQTQGPSSPQTRCSRWGVLLGR